MRYLALPDKCIVFFCDGCGKRLVGDDDGTPYWEDYDNFMDTVGTDEEEPTLFLCRKCLAKRKRGWVYDPEGNRMVDLSDEEVGS